jgi:hypothetical protein
LINFHSQTLWPNHTVLRRAALSGPERITNNSLIFNMDCVSNGLDRSWFPVTSYSWKCVACCAHQRLLFQHIHKFLLCKDVRPRKRSLFHPPPPPRVSLVSTISVSGATDFYNQLPGCSNVFDPENLRFCVYPNLKRTAMFRRRTGVYLTNSNCFCGPWFIHQKMGIWYFWELWLWTLKTAMIPSRGLCSL